jgi:hypothetical protein
MGLGKSSRLRILWNVRSLIPMICAARVAVIRRGCGVSMSLRPRIPDWFYGLVPAGQPASGRRRQRILAGQAMKQQVFAVAMALVWAVAQAGDLPDPRITPGEINPQVTQENIHQTVCVKGWTKSIRPPASYTNRLKKQQIRQYGYEDRNPKDYEEDHLIPLSVGGNPTDPRNLWPEPRRSEWGADRKDALEFALYKAVCHRQMSLAEAQNIFATDWISGYKRHGDLLRRYSHGAAK